MDFLYFVIGILVGVLMSLLNMILYRKEVQQRIKKMMGKKAVVVDMSEPFEDLGINFVNE